MNDKENIWENTDEVKILVRFNKQLIITRKVYYDINIVWLVL